MRSSTFPMTTSAKTACSVTASSNASSAWAVSQRPRLFRPVSMMGFVLDACDESTGTVTHTPQNVVCDDGLYCTGTETCDPNNNTAAQGTGCVTTALNLSDGIDCTIDSCDEVLNTIDHTPDNGLCSDAQFCNGVEICDVATGGCIDGPNPSADDFIACTVDTCDEINDKIIHIPNNALCDNGIFCDGEEQCNAAQGGCVASTAPAKDDGKVCTIDSCDEATKQVLNIPNDALCNNGLYCDGVEFCSTAPDFDCVVRPSDDFEGNTLNSELWETSASGSVTGAPGTAIVSTLNTSESWLRSKFAFTANFEIQMQLKIFGIQNDCTMELSAEDTVTGERYGWRWYNGNGTAPATQEAFDNTGVVTSGFGQTVGNYRIKRQGAAITATGPDTASSWSCFNCLPNANPVKMYVRTSCGAAGNNGTMTVDNFLVIGGANTHTINVDDGVDCTVDTCNETTNAAEHAVDHAACDDGQFCDGVEFCSPTAGCQEGTPPNLSDGVDCTIDTCDEVNDTKVNTPDDSFCGQ